MTTEMFNSGIMRHARRVVIVIVGGTVLLIGIVLIVLPGPSFIVIPAGLAILAVEFAWARNLLKKVRDAVGNNMNLFFWRTGGNKK